MRADEFDAGTGRWSIYDGPGHAGEGRRSPSAVSVRDGVLTITGDPSGTTAGMSWGDGRRYGRWEARVRAPAGDPSYNALVLLWPDAENWPEGGEIDFMEIGDPDRQEVDVFLHYGEDNEQKHGRVKTDATRWHNWAVEWTPTSITTFLDGRKWYGTTDRAVQPPGPMHLCIQLDWFPPGAVRCRSRRWRSTGCASTTWTPDRSRLSARVKPDGPTVDGVSELHERTTAPDGPSTGPRRRRVALLVLACVAIAALVSVLVVALQGNNTAFAQDTKPSTARGPVDVTTAAATLGWATRCAPTSSTRAPGNGASTTAPATPARAALTERSRCATACSPSPATRTAPPPACRWGEAKAYGRWEARVRAPAGDPLQRTGPALADADDFPQGGEIDFMELGDHGPPVHGRVPPLREGQRAETRPREDRRHALAQLGGRVDANVVTPILDGRRWYGTPTQRGPAARPDAPVHPARLVSLRETARCNESRMQVDWVREYDLGYQPMRAKSSPALVSGRGGLARWP